MLNFKPEKKKIKGKKVKYIYIPFPFSQAFDKNATNIIISATAAISPIKIASVFSISSSLLL